MVRWSSRRFTEEVTLERVLLGREGLSSQEGSYLGALPAQGAARARVPEVRVCWHLGGGARRPVWLQQK